MVGHRARAGPTGRRGVHGSAQSPAHFYTLLWGGADSIRTLNDKFADDDSDALTYSASAQYPGVLRLGY